MGMIMLTLKGCYKDSVMNKVCEALCTFGERCANVVLVFPSISSLRYESGSLESKQEGCL